MDKAIEACKQVAELADRIAGLSEVDAEIANDLHKIVDPVLLYHGIKQ